MADAVYPSGTKHSSSTPHFSFPFPSTKLTSEKCVFPTPIEVPSSPLTTNGYGSPVNDDTLPMSEKNLLHLGIDPPHSGIMPPLLTSYDATSPSHITYILASPPHLDTNTSPVTRTRPISPISPVYSPNNSVDNDIEFLFQQKTLDLRTLTNHKPPGMMLPLINPTSVGNIIVRQKKSRDNGHFMGCAKPIPFSPSDSHALVDVPITSSIPPRALRKNVPASGLT